MNFLFVYGTLLKKLKNEMSDFLVQHADVYDKGYFYGKLYDLASYPGAIAVDNPNNKVYGTIYQLKDAVVVLAVLDDYEEVGKQYPIPNEYVREKISVFTHAKVEIQCWVYLYNHSVQNLPVIVSGDYLKYLNQLTD